MLSRKTGVMKYRCKRGVTDQLTGAKLFVRSWWRILKHYFALYVIPLFGKRKR
jgi:hypothetical protein